MAMHPSRQAMVEEEPEEDVGVDINNIPTDTNYAIQNTNGEAQFAGDVLSDFARKRKIANIPVPTDDKRVRLELRSRGEPITLFGERPEDRRDRLRELLYDERGDDDEDMPDVGATAQGTDEQEEEFYTEGPAALLEARRDMAKYSIPRTQRKIRYQKIESRIPVPTHVKHRERIKDKLARIELFGSQPMNGRPVSMTRFSPNGDLIACGDWQGTVKLLNVPNLETTTTLRGHTDKIGGIAWFPGATLPGSSVSHDSINLASTGGEGNIHLWSLTQDTPLATLSGHTGRIMRCAFHPSGRFLASASYDTSWRLWDVQTTTELLLQEGHSREVTNVAFNDEGSLIASVGLDSIGRVWDTRTGRTIMLLDSHIKPIYALDWGPDGYRVLTGSADGSAKCWDIRAVKETATIPAHSGAVTDLRWYRGTDGPLSGIMPDRPHVNGDATMTGTEDAADDEDDNPASHYIPKKSGTFVVSSGTDKKVNIFSADDWAKCASLSGHGMSVLAVDVNTDASYLASCDRECTVKLWSRPDMDAL